MEEELKQHLANAVKEFLLKKYFEDDIVSKFGDISYCSETQTYASWILETIGQ
jgi:hypothetical protein